jgi:hypothetical protein
MKRKIILRIGFLLATVIFMVTCTKSDIQEARDAYKAANVVPVIQKMSGPTSVLKTFRFEYSVSGATRAGSAITWTGVDCVIDSLSSDKATAWVEFTTSPANDTALVKVNETTVGGVAAAEVIKKVKVNPFCPLAVSGLVGTWTGTDGQGTDYTSSATITTTLSGTKILVDGMNVGWMGDFWGESIISGGTCLMTVNNNGTVDIPEQFFCDTDYSSGYKIKGSGKWDNCGAKPTLVIDYDIWYPDSNYWIAARYKSYFNNIPYLTANITLN